MLQAVTQRDMTATARVSGRSAKPVRMASQWRMRWNSWTPMKRVL
jgi:hypothetical protein